MGRYQGANQPRQIVRPMSVMEELLATILTVQSFVIAALIIVGIATLATASLVFLLSLRLRRREIETMVKIGGSRTRIAAVLAAEVLVVVGLSITLAALLTWMTGAFGSDVIRTLIVE
jgi:putative ABC transport system permease protein